MYYYILNPASGGGRINKIQDRLKNRLRQLGIAGEFVKSIGEGDVTKLTLLGIKRGFKTIVAVGGDGTINEVINGIGDQNVALGIIPIGNTNELAKTLGISGWQSACNILAARKIETVDLGKIGPDYFVTAVNIGFEADISHLKPSGDSSPIRKFSYYRKALLASNNFKHKKAVINIDDNYLVETDFFNIQISNGQFSLLPMENAGIQDSLLDIIIIGRMSYAKTLRYAINP
ncbi:hypothetical protein M1307_03265, partial [Patescibacteria group bacterium]|nr:hypothetical protein [Patescibacteria group bacterium]